MHEIYLMGKVHITIKKFNRHKFPLYSHCVFVLTCISNYLVWQQEKKFRGTKFNEQQYNELPHTVQAFALILEKVT